MCHIDDHSQAVHFCDHIHAQQAQSVLTLSLRGGVRYFKGVFHPLVKAILGNDSAATKGSSITFGTSATTFTVFRCNSGAWRITKEFTTESECIAWCDTKLGKVGG